MRITDYSNEDEFFDDLYIQLYKNQENYPNNKFQQSKKIIDYYDGTFFGAGKYCDGTFFGAGKLVESFENWKKSGSYLYFRELPIVKYIVNENYTKFKNSEQEKTLEAKSTETITDYLLVIDDQPPYFAESLSEAKRVKSYIETCRAGKSVSIYQILKIIE